MSDQTAAEGTVELEAVASGIQYAIAASDMVVTSDSDMEIAADLIGQLQAVAKTIEERRVALTKPLLDVKRELDAAAKQNSGPIQNAILNLKASIKEYRERALAIAAAAQEQARQETGDQVVDPDSLPAAPASRVTGASGAGVSFRGRWTFQVTDLQALCKAAGTKAGHEEFGRFLLPSRTEIGDFVRKGGRELPGVRIYETEDVVGR